MSQDVDTTSGPRVPESRGTTRRTLVRGAAWSVPVIATAAAAPAFAASPCGTFYAGSLNWSTNYTRTNASAGTFSAPAGASAPVTGTLTSTFTNYTAVNGVNGIPNNLSSFANAGATNAPGLTLTEYANSNAASNNPANNQTLQIHFDRPVYDLTFLLTDIDYNAGQYKDQVAISFAGGAGVAFTATPVTGSTATGSGTTTSPITTTGTTNYDANTSSQGNITIKFNSRTLTDVYLTYWNGLSNIGTDTNYQGIFVGGLSFNTHDANVTC